MASDRMRITFVLPVVGMQGGIRVVAIYADGLRRRGHEVTLVSAPPATPSLTAKVRSLVKGRGWPNPPRHVRSHLDGLGLDHRVLDEARPVTDADVPDADVVVATWWETAAPVAALSASKGAKAYFMQDYGAAGQPLDRLIETWKLPLHIITIAPWLCDLMAEYGVRDVSLAFNGVDTSQFDGPSRGKQRAPTIGMVYSTLPEKGTDLACAAIESARQEVPQLQVLAFGSKPPIPQLPLPAGTALRTGVSDAELPKIYSQCDGWLFKSRREGFGLPILEAMACRTPVIATPAGAAPQLLADGGGILLPSYDVEPMAQAIVELVRMDEQRWRQMSDAARATALRYPWSAAIDAFEAGLRRAVDRCASSAIAG